MLSQLLTLYITPVIYSYLDRFSTRLQRRKSRRRSATPMPAEGVAPVPTDDAKALFEEAVRKIETGDRTGLDTLAPLTLFPPGDPTAARGDAEDAAPARAIGDKPKTS